MARKVRQPPTVSEKDNFRAREAFDNSVEDLLELVGSVTVTVGSIAAGAVGTLVVPVPGAKANQGMTVQYGLPSSIEAGVIAMAYVNTDDSVALIFYNYSAAPVVLAEHTYGIRVMP